jgi:hypothetical protein
LKLLEGLIIRSIAARSRGIELHPDIDACLLPVNDGGDQTRLGERELLDEKGILRGIDEFADRIQAIIGLDNQTRREREHDFADASTGALASLCYRVNVQLAVTRR